MARKTKPIAGAEPVATQARGHGLFHRRRSWKQYKTPGGATPVRDAIMRLPVADRAKVLAAMNDVAENGIKVARHLRNDVYEVRADGKDVIYRVLFATEGRNSQILLALEFLVKKTRQTPDEVIDVAEQRLRLHRQEGERRRRRT